MYAFFRVPGASDDSLSFAKRLVTDHGLGLAPGVAFGDEAETLVQPDRVGHGPESLEVAACVPHLASGSQARLQHPEADALPSRNQRLAAYAMAAEVCVSDRQLAEAE